MSQNDTIPKMWIHNKEFTESQYRQLLHDLSVKISTCNTETDNYTFLNELKNHVLSGKIIFNTQILLNFKSQKTLGACTVLRVNSDIMQNIKKTATEGLGFGVNLDEIEDPISFLDNLNSLLLDIEKDITRRVAAIATMRIDNPHIREFVKHKRHANFNRWRMNLSVLISDSFMNSVLDSHQRGETTSETELLDEVIDAMWFCGEPGILFEDKINYGNPIPQSEYIGMAPCAELAMSEGERCHFAYVNISKYSHGQGIDYEALKKAVRLITISLDNLIDISLLSDYNHTVFSKRRISIGICGLAELFIKEQVAYGSTEALKLTNDIMSVINYYSKLASVELAITRGSFPWLCDSRLLDYSWFISHGKGESEYVTSDMWHQLWYQIQKYGIRNCATVALPPTGNSAYINETTYSIEPIFDYHYTFIESELKKICLLNNLPFLDSVEETIASLPDHKKQLFLTCDQIPAEKHLSMLAVLQSNIDEAISKTINLPNHYTVHQILSVIQLAYSSGLKGITIFRNNCLAERFEL